MTGTPNMDRRRLERFRLQARAIVRSESSTEGESLELFTRDVSSGGAYFPVEVPLPSGEKVQITLFISISALDGIAQIPASTKIETKGRVVRSGAGGMAVKFSGNYSMSPAS